MVRTAAQTRSRADWDGTQNAGGAAAGQAQAPAETTQTAQTGSTAGTSGTAGAATQAAAPPRRRLRTRRRRTGGARAGSGTRRTGPRSWRHLARRSTAAVSALVLVAAVAGLTRWGRGAPAPTQPPVKAMTITDKGARTTYVCPAQPADTLAVTDKAPTTARTVITPLGQSRSITYRGEDLRVDAATSLGAGDGGVLTMEPAGDQAVSAASAVTTLTTGGDLRGLTAAPCTQPSATASTVYQAEAASLARMEKDERQGASPEQVAEKLYRMAVSRRRPRPLTTLGVNYFLLYLLYRLLPRNFGNWLVGRIYAPQHSN